jgi:hypothetical protein
VAVLRKPVLLSCEIQISLFVEHFTLHTHPVVPHHPNTYTHIDSSYNNSTDLFFCFDRLLGYFQWWRAHFSSFAVHPSLVRICQLLWCSSLFDRLVFSHSIKAREPETQASFRDEASSGWIDRTSYKRETSPSGSNGKRERFVLREKRA